MARFIFIVLALVFAATGLLFVISAPREWAAWLVGAAFWAIAMILGGIAEEAKI